jgi:hypothetical protein
MKGAHADLSSTAWQEIGVKPYFGLSGIMALDVPLLVCHARPKDKTPQKGTGSQLTQVLKPSYAATLYGTAKPMPFVKCVFPQPM